MRSAALWAVSDSSRTASSADVSTNVLNGWEWGSTGRAAAQGSRSPERERPLAASARRFTSARAKACVSTESTPSRTNSAMGRPPAPKET